MCMCVIFLVIIFLVNSRMDTQYLCMGGKLDEYIQGRQQNSSSRNDSRKGKRLQFNKNEDVRARLNVYATNKKIAVSCVATREQNEKEKNFTTTIRAEKETWGA